MPLLNLKKQLIPPTKIWRLFTKKLAKFQKPKRSKATKKLKHKSSFKKLCWPSALSIQPKEFKTKSSSSIHKRPPPVFVDQLFIDPVSFLKPSCSSSSKDIISHEINIAGDEHAVDDMWESLFLGSPQLQGINERAEEFIAKFRADMHNQEIVARRP